MEYLNIPRLKTIKGCLVEIKKIDKETAISEWYIRSLCSENKIKYFKSGNKSLVDFDSLIAYFNTKQNEN